MPASTLSRPGTRLVAVAVLPALLAAAAPATPESIPNQPRSSGYEERIEVNLITLDFLVTGKDGRPITDLRPDEVRIRDGGRTMRLAYLERAEDPPPWAGRAVPPAELDFQFGDAVQELALPGGHRSRWILFVLDRYNLGPDTRSRAIAATQRFLGESWRSGDRAGLAVYDTALRFVLDGVFTTDPSLVSVAIADPDRFQPDPNFDRSRELRDLMRNLDSCRQTSPVRPCALHLARRYVQQRVQEAENLLESLELAVRVLGTVPGRKYLVLFSNGFSIQPGAEAANALEAALGAEQVRGVQLELLWDVGRSLDDFVETAAHHQVTLFAIDTRRKPPGMLHAAQGALSNDRGAPVDPFLAELRDARATLTEMAEGTGGRHIIGRDATEGLAAAFRAAAGLYTAGYYLDDPDPRDWRRKVEVRIGRPGTRVTHRDHYRAIVPTPPPLRAGLVPGTPRPVSDRRVELPVTLQLDPSTLPFHLSGGRAVSQVTVHLALQDEGGAPVAEAFHFLALEYPEEPFRRQAINPPRYQGILAAPPGRYLLQAHLTEPGRGGVINFRMPVDLTDPASASVGDPPAATTTPPEGGTGP
jgi:VWFA-related protein